MRSEKEFVIDSPTWPVVEVFGPTIQGEGSVAGVRSHFVRFGYCDGLPSGHCTWCDSMHAVDPKFKGNWPKLTSRQIVDRVKALGTHCRTVTLSGGNPLLYDLEELVWDLNTAGYGRIWVETQGSIYRDWLRRVNVTVSPKPPSAGDCNMGALQLFIERRFDEMPWDEDGWLASTCMKIPIDPDFNNGDDFKFARWLINSYRAQDGLSFALSTVTYPDDTTNEVLMRWDRVVSWALKADIPDVRVLPQLHVVLWGHKQGV